MAKTNTKAKPRSKARVKTPEQQPILMSYANSKIEELDTSRQLLKKQIADINAETIPVKQLEQISGYLETWADVSFDNRRIVVDGLISTIKATSDKIDIDWKF